MTMRVALHHHSHYRFDREVAVFPHEIRLRPAAHNRIPILDYSLKVLPDKHLLHWQQDLYGNFVARLTVPEPTHELSVIVDLVADLGVMNPFDFFVEPWAEYYPFQYPHELHAELAPFLQTDSGSGVLDDWLGEFRAALFRDMTTTNVLVQANQGIWRSVSYVARMEPGIQACEETLTQGSGSCRDSAWLLIQVLRRLGIAARFVSGYFIQLRSHEAGADVSAGTGRDVAGLHAWCEAYIPGAGWIGLDPTSGLLAGEGHVALAATTQPAFAAPIQGRVGVCASRLEVTMTVSRAHAAARPRALTPVR